MSNFLGFSALHDLESPPSVEVAVPQQTNVSKGLVTEIGQQTCQKSGTSGERIGCRHSCKCSVFESCYTKVLDDKTAAVGEASHRDVGVCGLSMIVDVSASL